MLVGIKNFFYIQEFHWNFNKAQHTYGAYTMRITHHTTDVIFTV